MRSSTLVFGTPLHIVRHSRRNRPHILAHRDVLRGIVTTGLSLTWCVAVFYWVMPAFNVGKTFPLAAGYEYLGSTPLGILATGLHHPPLVVREMIRPPKLAYLFWLTGPVAFLCLLAPDALGVAAVALTIVLASTDPYTYEVFERYAAPIVPFVFYAVVVGVERIRPWLRLQNFGAVAIGLGWLVVTAGVTSGQYAIDVGLYALASMQRLTAFDARGGTIGDHVSFPVVVGRGR